tara:strand:- start:5964 stop:6560 length:597 start_codon:yes stop_codon:yes gene_type:complete
MALRSAKYAPNVQLNVKELEYFDKKLKALYGMTIKKRRKEFEKLTRHALAPTKKRMKQLAPMGKTGSLKKSITTAKAKKVGLGSRVGSRTGPVLKGKSQKKVAHAHLVELGTKKKMKRLRKGVGFGAKPFTFYSVRYKKVIRKVRIHHGSKAHPFIKPAYRQTRSEYVPRIKKKLLTRLKQLMVGTGRKSGITKIGKR